MQKIARPSSKFEYGGTASNGSVETMTAACVTELMNAATSFHKLQSHHS